MHDKPTFPRATPPTGVPATPALAIDPDEARKRLGQHIQDANNALRHIADLARLTGNEHLADLAHQQGFAVAALHRLVR